MGIRPPSSRPSLPLAAALLLTSAACGSGVSSGVEFRVSFPDSVHDGPVTGRVFVMVSRSAQPEPRFQAGGYPFSTPFFGMDVSALPAGQPVLVGDDALGYPVERVADLPPGDYAVQALVNVYTEFHRADGHTIWAHMDQWEGQHFNRSPGNLYSDVAQVHIDAGRTARVELVASHRIPPVEVPPDTKWVKRVKIQSEKLTGFWGHPFYVGATVLLPAGYDEHPDVRYPVVYLQGHFSLQPPYGFTPDSTPVPEQQRAALANLNRETGFELYRAWTRPDFPRMIVVTFQHPTPFFDDSYAMNSANNGPYGDALLQELVPYLESHFRMIPRPYARVLTGGSTGGWESIALMVHHPTFFAGTWTLYPDPVDFRHYGMVNVYQDSSAFTLPGTEWQQPDRFVMRAADGQTLLSIRDFSRMEAVLGSHGRSGEQLEAWESVYGPVGDDGYPRPVWDKLTGEVDHDVAAYMRDNGYDLRAWLAAHWDSIGPDLVDKIHVDVGDMDNFYLDLAVYDLQAFLDSTTAPKANATFRYGRPEKGHGWQHTTTADMLREMADFITRHAPPGADTRRWKYR
jgi:hypothetical protein